MPTGTELSYRSRFTVKSYDRIFEPANAHVTWLDFQNARLPAEKYSEPLSPELVKLVNDTRRKHQPAAAIQVLCRWVKENINYDASVWWPNEEVKATVSYRKGHCGHMVNVFRQICAIAGIPYRIVYGMNLTVPNGVDALANVREDFTNAHTWAEVFFPNVGWIEVEVASGKNCFAISRCFVQNNSDFENYSIWVTEKDQLTRVPVWKFVDGKFVCDYSVKHRITYTERDLAPRVPFER
jgi:transglutaminase-like putative cysteine protease